MRFVNSKFCRWDLKNLEYCDIDSLIGESSFIKELKKLSLVLCKNNASILLKGEKGTGKNYFARLVHIQGKNNPEDFFELNCRVFTDSETLSFFNLISQIPSMEFLKKTVYISNIEDLSLELQNSLLQLLMQINNEKKNIRFVFSTEVNIEDKIDQGLFSKDLYFYLSAVPVNMIPLRQRKEDILLLAEYFLRKISLQNGVCYKGFSETAKEDMINHFWSGNISELKNAVERAYIIGEFPFILTKDMAIGFGYNSDNAVTDSLQSDFEDKSLKNAVNSFKKSYVTKVLEENNWNQTKAAKVLGIQRTYVIKLMAELHIRK